MNMWTGLLWHRTALCKQRDRLYMSQDPWFNRKYISVLQQWHRQVHRNVIKLAHIQWSATCFGQQCCQQCWSKHV